MPPSRITLGALRICSKAVSEISKTESHTCVDLRPILDELPIGSRIPDSDLFRRALSGLEYFIPAVLGEVHDEWRDGDLDGIFPDVSLKTAERELEVIGLCIFIGDQGLTPIRLRLQLDATTDAISWLECWVGETTAEGMLRIPYTEESRWRNKLNSLSESVESIDWTYHVGYGERR